MKARDTVDEREVEERNRVQREFFDRAVDVFEPPLPEGVPERLERIVAAACIVVGDTVLDVGSGTGILLPLIERYGPVKVYACDLSGAMLERLKQHFPYAETLQGDARDLTLPDGCIDVVFMNAVYPNIVDKAGTFSTMNRVMKAGARMVISHPMGKSFITLIRQGSPFHLDDFPERGEAEALMEAHGFEVTAFVDEAELYILAAVKR